MKVKLRELMETKGVSGAQVAEALGVTPASVSAWLVGERRRGAKMVRSYPDLESLEALCVLFEVTPAELLEVEASTTPTGKTLADLGTALKRGRPRRPAGIIRFADVAKMGAESREWAGLALEDAAKGIAAAEAGVPVEEMDEWITAMQGAVKPL